MREQANVRTSQYTSFIKRERKIDYFWRSLQLMPIRRSDYSGEYLFILMLKFHSILSLIDDDIKLMSSGLWDFQRIVCVFFGCFFGCWNGIFRYFRMMFCLRTLIASSFPKNTEFSSTFIFIFCVAMLGILWSARFSERRGREDKKHRNY